MKKGNIVAGLLCLALGIYVVITCLGYPTAAAYGTGAPGPGLWPGLIGAGLIIASLWILITTFRAPEGSLGDIEVWGTGSKRVYITMVILAVYVFLLPTTGFIPVTIVLLFILIQWFAKYKWYKTLGISVVITIVIYAVFKFALNVPIDFGMISF